MRDPHIGVAADLARADVRRHIAQLCGRLEDRLGLNTWEARRARMHDRLDATRDMLNAVHEDALRHLGGDLPAGVEFAGVPIHTDVRLDLETTLIEDGYGKVLAVIERDSRGRFVRRTS